MKRSSAIICTTLFAGLGALLLQASPADAFCIIRDTGRIEVIPGGYKWTCCSGFPRRWLGADIPVDIHISDVTPLDARDAIRRGEDTWTDVWAASFAFRDAGLTSRVTRSLDGFSIVGFDTVFCSHNPGLCGQGILAITSCFTQGSGSSYHAIECDIIFNAQEFQFSTDPGPREIDPEGVAAHELGHDLGHAHPNAEPQDVGSAGCGPTVTAATMYSFIQGSGVLERSLELDDIAGAVAIYPRWFLSGEVTDASSGDPLPTARLDMVGAWAPLDTIVRGDLPSPLPGDGASSPTYLEGALPLDADGAFSFAASESAFTMIASAVGYFSDTAQIVLGRTDTISVSLSLSPTARSALQGTVTDGRTDRGISARVVLLLHGAPFDSAQTNPSTGVYLLDDLPITNPPVVTYTGLIIRPALPYPVTSLPETLRVEAGGPTVRNVDLLPGEVFLVDDDGGEEVETFLLGALDSLGRTAAVLDVARSAQPPGAFLRLFPRASPVLWLTGRGATATLTPADQESLSALLARGGRLLLTGQNIAEDLEAQGSPFLSGVLHVGHGGNTTTPFARGTADAPVGERLGLMVTAGPRGANDQTSRDLLLPDGVAQTIATYRLSPADTTSRGTAAVLVDNLATNRSRILFFGFGLEAVNRPNPSDTSFATRQEVLDGALDWLEESPVGVEGAPEEGPRVPPVARLLPNYPNPFNPRTVLTFWVPAASLRERNHGPSVHVTLHIYSLRGHLVRTLLNRDLPPGLHQATWDGRDGQGHPVASGVYVACLEAAGQTLARKLTLLR